VPPHASVFAMTKPESADQSQYETIQDVRLRRDVAPIVPHVLASEYCTMVEAQAMVPLKSRLPSQEPTYMPLQHVQHAVAETQPPRRQSFSRMVSQRHSKPLPVVVAQPAQAYVNLTSQSQLNADTDFMAYSPLLTDDQAEELLVSHRNANDVPRTTFFLLRARVGEPLMRVSLLLLAHSNKVTHVRLRKQTDGTYLGESGVHPGPYASLRSALDRLAPGTSLIAVEPVDAASAI
jgi:hypothetical protein